MTTITLPRAIVEQALEALRLNNDEWKALADSGDCGRWTAESQDHYKQTNAAIVALEAALAQQAEPVQEPVAWRWGYRSVTTGEMDWRGYVEIAAHPNLRSPEIIMEPLYAAPPQRPAEPVQEPVALKWLPAPRKTEWGFGMVSADVEIDRDHTLTMYCEDDQTAKVDAMFRRVFCKGEA